jgi:sarcosine oxidase subunit beta
VLTAVFPLALAMTTTADIVIIGGGVHGCSLAFHLSTMGAGRVILVEKKHIASGPTAQSGAMIRALFEDRIYVDLVRASTRMFENWSELVGGDAGFVQEGFLRITDSLELEDLGGDLELTKAADEPYQVLSRDQVSRLVPSGEFRDGEFGILFPKGGYADPYKTTVELAEAAHRQGVEVREGVQVTGIRIEHGRVTAVETDSGTMVTPLVVNCAGAWSDRVARMAGIDLPIVVRATPTCLFRRPDSMRTVGPILSDGVNKVYLRTLGEAVYRAAHFGYSDQIVDADNFDESVSASQTQMLRKGLHDRYDDMRRTPYMGGFSALYDMTPDSHPIVGSIDGVEGFWCDCGWSGNGFAPAPASGRSLAQTILGRPADIDLSFFRWPRHPEIQARTAVNWVHE